MQTLQILLESNQIFSSSNYWLLWCFISIHKAYYYQWHIRLSTKAFLGKYNLFLIVIFTKTFVQVRIDRRVYKKSILYAFFTQWTLELNSNSTDIDKWVFFVVDLIYLKFYSFRTRLKKYYLFSLFNFSLVVYSFFIYLL